jgi:prolyl oligopeptidase
VRRPFSLVVPWLVGIGTAIAFHSVIAQPIVGDPDPYLWLENLQSERATAWVKERNSQSQVFLEALPKFAERHEKLKAVYNGSGQIPAIVRRGEYVTNNWRDAKNPRGLWRRTTLTEYRKETPQWETLLDLDALAKTEGESWVWAGAQCLAPEHNRCLLSLSRGGADATVIREYDLVTRTFVKDGFSLPEAKTTIRWKDANTVLVATNFGVGSLTKSGYARIVKQWKRGGSLETAPVVFKAQETDMSALIDVDRTPGFERVVLTRRTNFYNTEAFLVKGNQLIRLDKPSDATLMWRRDWAFLRLSSDYTLGTKEYKSGSLLAIPADAWLRGEHSFDVLFEPTATRTLSRRGVSFTRDHVLVHVLDNVAGRLEEMHYQEGRWVHRVVGAPFPGELVATGLHDPSSRDDKLADQYLLKYTDNLTPDTLFLGTTGSDQRDVLKSLPSLFDSTGMRAEQRFATSKDGTRIPYFVVWPKGAKADGSNPTILYGYGGFQSPLTPGYLPEYGTAWSTAGGVLVIANIRGGGEFGPTWHTAAIKANKQRSYDDFIAVAEDLIASKITSPKHLGISGLSNGGLLVGAVMIQRPELFGAVLSNVPLMDMRRYNKLLAGNSWMAEYGNPDIPEEWAWISKYSPYQNVKAGVKYPTILFTSSTRDDRVHPAHARKMVARMLEQGHKDVLYYENTEGGHLSSGDKGQRAYGEALEFAFFWHALGGS